VGIEYRSKTALIACSFTAVTKPWFKYEKTYYLLFEDLPLNQKQK